MKLITGTNSKLRELYEAVKREQDGNGESPKERVTCESALREAGIDEKLIGKKLKEQLEAKHPRWNPKKKAFDLFPDHGVDLPPAGKLSRYLAAMQPKEKTKIGHLSSSTLPTHGQAAVGVITSREIQRRRSPHQKYSVTGVTVVNIVNVECR